MIDLDWLQPLYKCSDERVKLYILQGLGVSSVYLKTLLAPVNATVILVVLLVSVMDSISTMFSLAMGSTLHDRNILFEVVENTLKSKINIGSPIGQN